MSFRLKDKNDPNDDKEKVFVEEQTQSVVVGTFTLADQEAALAKWQETLRQATENIAIIEQRIAEIKKLLK